MNKLTNKNTDLPNQTPCIIKQTLIPINLRKGQTESIDLLKSMYSCQDEKAYSTDFCKMIIEFKWLQICSSRFLLFWAQVLQFVLFNIYVYQPTEILWVWVNIVSGIFYLWQEILITYKLGMGTRKDGVESFSEKMKRLFAFNSIITVALSILTLVYFVSILNGY